MRVEEVTDAMRLIVGTGQTASQCIETREQRRRDQDGWIVPPPIPLEQFAGARMMEPAPGETALQPNAIMRDLKNWFVAIFDAGGTEQDLRRAWAAWPSTNRFGVARGPAANEFEALVRRARAREIELSNKSNRETEPARRLALARGAVTVAQHRADLFAAEVTKARAHARQIETETGDSLNAVARYAQQQIEFAEDDLARAQRELEQAERQLNEIGEAAP